ncbi:jg19823 [Pararge aegeria aegeria]|uniref:Jg19823 protein n=1 Tax=Pararge aegeria aegeria TaxID=348720 RepID=A0A8S4SKU5_9NEOP|nr:jg19823 [Pararge aegeria aegeria]
MDGGGQYRNARRGARPPALGYRAPDLFDTLGSTPQRRVEFAAHQAPNVNKAMRDAAAKSSENETKIEMQKEKQKTKGWQATLGKHDKNRLQAVHNYRC